MPDNRNTPAHVEVGQRYEGWGKTWEVTRVWDRERVAEIVNVERPGNKMRLPLTQFVELRRV
jgi:hypothetical protein